MEDTRIEKRVGVKASPERIWDLVADLSSWSRWNTVETDVEGAIAFGGHLTLTEAYQGLPERRATAQVAEWQPLARLVWAEKRGWLFRTVRYIEILDEVFQPMLPGAAYSGYPPAPAIVTSMSPANTSSRRRA